MLNFNNKLKSILITEEMNVCLNLFFSIEYLLHFTNINDYLYYKLI